MDKKSYFIFLWRVATLLNVKTLFFMNMVAMGSVSGQAITLANSIIGVGILAMPFCFKQCGIILSILILIVSGFVSRLASHLLLKSAIVSRRKNFEALAYQTFGSAGKFAVEVGIIGFLMGTCVAYFVVVGDIGPQIIAKMLNLNQSDTLRTSVMVVVSLVCVLPLGLLRNVDSLSNVCAATIGFYFCLVLKVIGEATGPLFSGEWLDKVNYWEPSGVLQCLPIFSMALFCQTQLFEIYDTLPSATLEKMNNVTKNAVNICSVVYVLVGLFGYIAFCNQPISGNILLSFSPTLASDAIKMGFVMSLAFSFPLIIFPCRASLYSLLYRKGQASHHELLNNLIPEVRFKCLTVGIIAVSLIVGLMLPNIELVLGLVGSTIGVIICVIFPATCFICISSKNTNERLLAQLVLCFGIIIMILGTYANLQAAEIDNIRMVHKIDIGQNKFDDNKILNALSPDDKDHDTNIQIIANRLINENKKAYNDINADKAQNAEIVKQPLKVDSLALPPNPVPPKEDHTDKKVEPILKAGDEVKTNLQPQADLTDKEGAGDREVQLETNIGTIPGILLKDVKPPQESVKINDAVDVVEKQNIEAEEKSDDGKENKLMDTIKKHAEEQRQMVLEQQKILKEIKETQKDIAIKQKADETLSAETKKLAVENIQKIAKMAIESLGGQVEMTTLATIKKISQEKQNTQKKISNNGDQMLQNQLISDVNNHENPKKETVKQNQFISDVNNHEEQKKEIVKQDLFISDVNNFEEQKKESGNIINQKLTINLSDSGHTRDKDDPESYKNGEGLENLKVMKAKKNVSLINPKDSENIANRLPIAIAMSKINNDKHVEKTPEKDVKKDNLEVDNKTDETKKKQVESNNVNGPQDDYVGGKRDILEVHTTSLDIINENNKISNVHYRNKRDVLNCPGKIISNNRGIQVCQVNEEKDDADNILKLSKNIDILKVSDAINNIDHEKYVNNLMSSANIVDFHIRNLKSVKINNITK